jgi:hypothetical protein
MGGVDPLLVIAGLGARARRALVTRRCGKMCRYWWGEEVLRRRNTTKIPTFFIM